MFPCIRRDLEIGLLPRQTIPNDCHTELLPVLTSICKSASELYESVWGRGGIAPLIIDLGTIPGNSQLYVPVATMALNISGSPVRTLLFLAARILNGPLDFGKICAPLLGVHGIKAGRVPGSAQTVCRRDTTLVFAVVCTRL